MAFKVMLLTAALFLVCAVELHGADARRSTLDTSTVQLGDLDPEILVLDDLSQSDKYAIAMTSIAEGGRLSQCRSSGTTYMKLRGADNMNAIARTSPLSINDVGSPEDDAMVFANHETVANVFPTTAVVFANHSTGADVVSFRLYTVKLQDLISELEDPDLLYRMELMRVLETIGNTTSDVPLESLFVNGPLTFPTGTMMIDLIDVDDANVADERKQYTLGQMSKSGELAYNADKYAVMAMGGEDTFVGAQGRNGTKPFKGFPWKGCCKNQPGKNNQTTTVMRQAQIVFG